MKDLISCSVVRSSANPIVVVAIFIMKGNAKFQLEVSKNKCVISFPIQVHKFVNSIPLDFVDPWLRTSHSVCVHVCTCVLVCTHMLIYISFRAGKMLEQ